MKVREREAKSFQRSVTNQYEIACPVKMYSLRQEQIKALPALKYKNIYDDRAFVFVSFRESRGGS